MTHDIDIISKAEALKAGLQPLTHPYLVSERPLMAGVIKDMERGGIRHAFVEGDRGIAIWRSPCSVTATGVE